MHGLSTGWRVTIKAPAMKNNRWGTKNSGNNNNNQNPYMVVPYYKELSESLTRTCSKHGLQVFFNGGMTIKNFLVAPKDKDPILMEAWPSRTSLWLQRTKIPSSKRVESFTDINVIGWSVMDSILENLQHFERGSKNIKKPLPLYMTIKTSLVIMSPHKNLVYWGGKARTSLEPSKKHYS